MQHGCCKFRQRCGIFGRPCHKIQPGHLGGCFTKSDWQPSMGGPMTLPFHDPTALAGLGGLDLIAKQLVEGYLIGQHQSPFKGSSVEFVEHRPYYPGDEIRHIDWRAYAKTGKYYVKEYEEETNLRCQLLVDCSGSMAFRGRTLSKYDYARQLAAALTYLLLAQRDACGLITFHTEIADRLEPATQPLTFQHITRMLAARKPGAETGLARVLEQIHPTVKRRGLIVLLSDCFDHLDSLMQGLQQRVNGRLGCGRAAPRPFAKII